MSWNIGDNRKHFLKLKSKLRLYLIVLLTRKTSPKKLTFTVTDMQQLSDIEKTDSKDEISCLKPTVFNGRRKVRVTLNTGTDKLKAAVYHFRNWLYLKDVEIDLKLTEYQSLLAKPNHLLSYNDILYKRCILLEETSVRNWNIFCQACFSDCIRG